MAESNEHIHTEHRGDVVVLRIHRPHKRNALTGSSWTELRDKARALHAKPPRVCIVTGAGGHFCSGMDLSLDNPLLARMAPAAAAQDTAALRDLIDELKQTMHAVATMPCVTIAAIDGVCVGAGLELALACDLRIASDSARFALPETRIGFVPDVGGTVRLTRLVGTSHATDLILTGRRIDTRTAARWGLVDRVVDDAPKDAALDAAIAFAKLMRAGGPESSRQALSVIRAVPELSDEAAFELETQAGIRALCSGEFMEGTQAFIQKREPRWPSE